MPLIEWHIKSTTKAQQGLYEYDAVSRLRDGQLGDPRVHDIGNYIVRGKLWDAFEADEPVGGADRRDRQGGHRVPQRPAARTRSHAVLRLRDAPDRGREAAPGRHHHLEQREGAAGRVPAPLLLPLHPLPRPRDDGADRRRRTIPDIRQDLAREALNVFFQIRDVPGLKKKPATSELLDWLKLLMVEDLPAEALRSQRDARGDPAAARRAAEERAGRASVRAPGLPGAARQLRTAMFAHLIAGAAAGGPAGLDHRIPDAAGRDEGGRRRITASTISTTCRRATLVKDERHLDRFDRVFAECFKGLEAPDGESRADLPEEWLRKLAEKLLTPEEMAQIEALGGFDKLMETLARALAEQKGRHQGGSKWIGTAGTSPFGAYGYNPEGVRIGQDESRHRRAVKVWDKREFRDLDDKVGARHAQHEAGAAPPAPLRPRRVPPTELDMPDTIRSTAKNAGMPGPEDGAGAAQHGEGAAVPRHRRLDGRSRQAVRGTVLGRPHRVQAPGVFLLPQLPLRASVEEQPPPPRSRDRHLRSACAPTARTTS